jgi:hypothetical protein
VALVSLVACIPQFNEASAQERLRLAHTYGAGNLEKHMASLFWGRFWLCQFFGFLFTAVFVNGIGWIAADITAIRRQQAEKGNAP